MRKARFTEHQIIAVIKSVEAGRTAECLTGSQQIAAILSCDAWIMVQHLSHWHWLNRQRNMQ